MITSRHFISTTCLLLGQIAWGGEVTVHNGPELATAIARSSAGDTIVLAKGTWSDVTVAVGRGGAPGKPLTIRAEIPGATILNGSSMLALNAPYVTVDGLFFYHGAIKKGAVIELNSHDGIVRNSAVVDYNPADFATKYYWVFFEGDNNLVDHCYFKGKNHMEPLIGNAIEASRHNSVRHCYIKNIPYDAANGREDLRIWGAGKFDAGDQGGTFFTIEGNLFDHADGEGVEIISLKSNHNQVLNNTIIATRGGINIRQGSYNLVQGNIILGQSREGSQGLRMSGYHNTVRGNFVSDCEDGIRVATGEYIAGALTDHYQPKLQAIAKSATNPAGRTATYPQVRDLTLSDNVTVGISGADLEVGFAYKRHWPEEQEVLVPEGCTIKNNRFVRPQGGDAVIGSLPDATPPLDKLHFEPNHYEANFVVGGKVAFAPAAAGCQTESMPAGWNEASERAAFVALTPADVGPAWVIALRAAGQFPMEDDQSCYRTTPAPDHPKKAKKKNRSP